MREWTGKVNAIDTRPDPLNLASDTSLIIDLQAERPPHLFVQRDGLVVNKQHLGNAYDWPED